MDLCAITDKGRVRRENQDSCYIYREEENDLALLLVCDGMGGHNAGNVASSLAATVFAGEVKEGLANARVTGAVCNLMKSALRTSNNAVYELSDAEESCRGMGTTLVSAIVLGDDATVMNVGDSRAYHVSADVIRQVTRDHSVVEDMVERGDITREESRTHPSKNLITRAVGTSLFVEADFFSVKLRHGDTLLLLCGIQRYGETYELGSTKGSSDTTNSATLVTYTSGGGSVTPGPDEPDPDTNYGTKEEPLSVAEALALGKDLAKNEVLGGTTPQVVYVTGYVVEVGTFNRTYNNFNSFYIADSQDGTKATGLCVYGLNLNAEGTFTRKGDLVKGAQITLYGALKGYEPSTGTLYPELTFSGSVKVYASSYTDPRTDAEKAQAAVTAVEFESMDLTGDIELPKPTVTGVTFAWVSDNQAATVDSATNKLTVTRGDADQNVKLTLTATCGTQGTATEDYNFVVKQKLNLTPGEQNFTIDFSTNFTTYTDSSEWKDSSNRYGVYGEHTLSFATLGVSTVEGTVELNNASRQNSTITTLPTLAAKNTLTAYVTVHAEGVSIQSLTFNLQEWTNKKKFSKIVIETSTNGSTWTEYGTAVGDGTSNTLLISENDTFTFTATDDTVTYVRLAIYATGTSNVQVGIKSIEMKVKTLSATVAAPAQVAILPGKEF